MEFFGAIYYSGFHIVTIMASAQRLYQFGYDVLGTMTLFFLLFPGIFMSLVLTFFPSTLVFPINVTACYIYFEKKKVASNKFRNFPINMQFSSIKITIITTNMFIPTNTFIPTNQHVYSNQPTRLFGTLGKQGHRRYQHLTYPFLLKFVFICYSSVPIWL